MHSYYIKYTKRNGKYGKSLIFAPTEAAAVMKAEQKGIEDVEEVRRAHLIAGILVKLVLTIGILGAILLMMYGEEFQRFLGISG